MTDNYDFLKTGFDVNSDEANMDKYMKDATALLVLFMENSIRNADIYVKHAKRNSITAKDIKMAMMLELFLYKNRNDNSSKLKDIKNDLFYNDDDDNENGDNDLDKYMIYDSTEDPFKKSTCECGMCACLNNIDSRWSKFKPNNKLEEILKTQIDIM